MDLSFFYVSNVLPASVVVPLGIGAFRRVYTQRHLRPVFIYLMVSGLTNVLATLIGATRTNNLPLLHIYTIVEFLVLMSYYQRLLVGKVDSGIFRLLMFAFPLLAVLNFLLWQSLYSFNSYPRALSCVIVVMLGSSYFLTNNAAAGHSKPDSWINFGFMLYFGSAVFMFAFANLIYAHTSRQGQNVIGLLHATLVLIMYFMIGFGFLKARQSG